MSLIALKCISCGANLEVDESRVIASEHTAVLHPGVVVKCAHCGTEHIADMELERVPVTVNGINLMAGGSLEIGGSIIEGDVVNGNVIIINHNQVETIGRLSKNVDKIHRGAIFRSMIETFNLQEVDGICFELGINHESIPGRTIESKARELILYTVRHQQLDELVEACIQLRPMVAWPGWTPSSQTVTESRDRPAEAADMGLFGKVANLWAHLVS